MMRMVILPYDHHMIGWCRGEKVGLRKMGMGIRSMGIRRMGMRII